MNLSSTERPLSLKPNNALVTLSFSALSQESSREWAPGVWELTTVDVEDGYMSDYMDGLEQTWIPAAKIQKEMGILGHGITTSPEAAIVKLHYALSTNKNVEEILTSNLFGEEVYQIRD